MKTDIALLTSAVAAYDVKVGEYETAYNIGLTKTNYKLLAKLTMDAREKVATDAKVAADTDSAKDVTTAGYFLKSTNAKANAAADVAASVKAVTAQEAEIRRL